MEQARDNPVVAGHTGSVVAVILGSFLVRLGGAATGVMLGFLLAHLHRTGVANSSAMIVGLLAAAFYLSELVGSPIAGFLIDRRGLRPLLLAGPILGIIASAIIGSAAHLGFLIAARLLQGLTTACTIPAALAFLSDETRGGMGNRGRTMSMFEVGSIGGLAIGLVLGGRVWSAFGRSGFWALAGAYCLAVALFVLIKAGSVSSAGQPLTASLPAIRQSSDLMPAWLAVNAAAGLWFAHAAYQFSGARPIPGQMLTAGMPEQNIGLISTLLAGGQLIGALSGGPLANAWGVDGLVVGTIAFGVIGFLTLPRDSSPPKGQRLRASVAVG